jgi:cytochrome c-type biogenesis protein
MEAISFALAFLAGVISIFSPCVLPLLPVVLGAAASQHRLGPVALAAGLALSFLILGLLVATFGFAVGIETEALRTSAAVLLIAAGGLLLAPPLQARIARAAAPLSNQVDRIFGGKARRGLAGQFGLGLLLGAVWAPCTGPTLGAASVLAAQGRELSRAVLTMLLFALGTSLPLLLLGFTSRQALMRWRGHLAATGAAGKALVGAALVGIGALVLAGYDKIVESRLVDLMPDWLVDLTTAF